MSNRSEFADAQKLIAAEWKALAEDDRAVWNDKAAEARAQWEAAVAAAGGASAIAGKSGRRSKSPRPSGRPDGTPSSTGEAADATPLGSSSSAAAGPAAGTGGGRASSKSRSSRKPATPTPLPALPPPSSRVFLESSTSLPPLPADPFLASIETKTDDPATRARVRALRLRLEDRLEEQRALRHEQALAGRQAQYAERRRRETRGARSRAVQSRLPVDDHLLQPLDKALSRLGLADPSQGPAASDAPNPRRTLLPTTMLTDPSHPGLSIAGQDVAQVAVVALAASRIGPAASTPRPVASADLGVSPGLFSRLIVVASFIADMVSDVDDDHGAALIRAGQAAALRVAGRGAAQGVSTTALGGLLAVGPAACGEGLIDVDPLSAARPSNGTGGASSPSAAASAGEPAPAAASAAVAASSDAASEEASKLAAALEAPRGKATCGRRAPPALVPSRLVGLDDADASLIMPVNPARMSLGHLVLAVTAKRPSWRCHRLLARIHVSLLRTLLEDVDAEDEDADEEDEEAQAAGAALSPTLDMLSPITWPSVLRMLLHPDGDALAQRLRTLASPEALATVDRLREVEYAALSPLEKTTLLTFLVDAVNSTGRMRGVVDARSRAASAVLRAKVAEDQRQNEKFTEQ
ncbi:unnamed protein product, partial [Symbiodinium sp. KB8]